MVQKGKRLVALSAKTPGLNVKVPQSVRLRPVCSERCAWDRDAQGNFRPAVKSQIICDCTSDHEAALRQTRIEELKQGA
jgi:hypothetical protein